MQCCWGDKCYNTLNGSVYTHQGFKSQRFYYGGFLGQGMCYFSLVTGQFLFRSWAWEQILHLTPNPKLTSSKWNKNEHWRLSHWVAFGEKGDGLLSQSRLWVVVPQAWWGEHGHEDGTGTVLGSWEPVEPAQGAESASSPRRRGAGVGGGRCQHWLKLGSGCPYVFVLLCNFR